MQRTAKGERTSTGTATDAVTRRREQGRSTEADGWRVQITPRWAALGNGIGGEERVKREDFSDERPGMERR